MLVWIMLEPAHKYITNGACAAQWAWRPLLCSSAAAQRSAWCLPWLCEEPAHEAARFANWTSANAPSHISCGLALAPIIWIIYSGDVLWDRRHGYSACKWWPCSVLQNTSMGELPHQLKNIGLLLGILHFCWGQKALVLACLLRPIGFQHSIPCPPSALSKCETCLLTANWC